MNDDLYNYLINNGIADKTIKENKEKISQIINSIHPKTNKDIVYKKIFNYLSRPNLFEQVKSFISSSSKYIANGMSNVSDEIKDRRMLICQSCDFFDESSDRCNHCGCFLKIKTSWASEKCPIDKWLSEIEPENIQEQQQQNPSVKDCGCKNK